MIALHYEAPDERLSPLVSSFYLFDFQGEAMKEIERADRAQFRFVLKGQGEYHFSSGRIDPGFPITILGPTTAAVESCTDGPITIFGWGLTPAGWDALMGGQSESWVDRTFDARAIFGDWIMDIRQQIIDAPDRDRQFAIGRAAATEIFREAATAPFEFTAKVDRWLLANADPNVEDLALATGLSPRQLERMAKRFYGMPPKKLARKYRALRAAHKLATGDSLDEAGLGLAFYDQSHLIREIKQFTGLTPSQLKAGSSELTNATIRGRSSLGSQVSPLVSES